MLTFEDEQARPDVRALVLERHSRAPDADVGQNDADENRMNPFRVSTPLPSAVRLDICFGSSRQLIDPRDSSHEEETIAIGSRWIHRGIRGFWLLYR